MARPTSKEELRTAAELNWRRLWSFLDGLDPPLLSDIAFQAPVDDRSRNPRDVLCHLHAWHLLMLRWYEDGMAGRTPAMPAPGHTWRTTPALNDEIWERHRHTGFDEARALVNDSHRRVMALVEAHDDAELFTRKRYAWTGSTSLGAYVISATSSHYDWAIRTLRKQVAAAPSRNAPRSRSDVDRERGKGAR